jgi:hypothetical protein
VHLNAWMQSHALGRACADTGLRPPDGLEAYRSSPSVCQNRPECDQRIDLALCAQRLGCGVRLEDAPALFLPARQQCTALEICQSSGAQARAIANLREHRIDQNRRLDLPVTPTACGRTTSSLDLTQLHWRLVLPFGGGLGRMLEAVRKAPAIASLANEKRAKRPQTVDQQWHSP